jgi:Bacterial PH domain
MKYVFQIATGSNGPFVLVAIVGVILLGVLALITYAALGSRRARFDVSAEGLEIHGDMFGRRIPAAAIDAGAVRLLDLGQEDSLAPRRRTLGSGFPGYLAGWFRLKNGRKALLFVTDRSRLVYVPTSGGFDVMLSVADPGAFVRRAKEVWGGGE